MYSAKIADMSECVSVSHIIFNLFVFPTITKPFFIARIGANQNNVRKNFSIAVPQNDIVA